MGKRSQEEDNEAIEEALEKAEEVVNGWMDEMKSHQTGSLFPPLLPFFLSSLFPFFPHPLFLLFFRGKR